PVLALGHLGHAQVKRPGDLHPVPGFLISLRVLVVLRRAHQELAGRDEHQLHPDRVDGRPRWIGRRRPFRGWCGGWRGRHVPQYLTVGGRYLDVPEPIGGPPGPQSHLSTREAVAVGFEVHRLVTLIVVERADDVVAANADASAIPTAVDEVE